MAHAIMTTRDLTTQRQRSREYEVRTSCAVMRRSVFRIDRESHARNACRDRGVSLTRTGVAHRYAGSNPQRDSVSGDPLNIIHVFDGVAALFGAEIGLRLVA